jgi:cellulose synthase/poly-beta-1,6-N-acetylglucosamine synthase-like glycosyltransferase
VTQKAAAALRLPPHVRVVVVPSGGPQTKPKALNYALAFVRSELVVVFDAEDRPEPDQLRMAAAAFAKAGPDLACLQARLNVFNPGATFFTR